jgi:hypothetical protein
MLHDLDRPEKPMRQVDSNAPVGIDMEARIVVVATDRRMTERLHSMRRTLGRYKFMYVLQVSSSSSQRLFQMNPNPIPPPSRLTWPGDVKAEFTLLNY